MKKLFTITALALSVLTSVTAKEPAATRKVDANNVFTASKSFGVSMYAVQNSSTVKLLIETKGKVLVKVLDAAGNVLSRENVKSSGSINLNMAEVPAGEYFVEVSDGKETITRQLKK